MGNKELTNLVTTDNTLVSWGVLLLIEKIALIILKEGAQEILDIQTLLS